MKEITMAALQLIIVTGAFCIGRYILPNIPKSAADKLNELSAWAAQFVVWAREFMKTKTGQEKMKQVVKKLHEIANEAGIDVTDDQLQAIAQTAYEAMEDGRKAAKPETPAAPTVTIYNTAPAADDTEKPEAPLETVKGYTAGIEMVEE